MFGFWAESFLVCFEHFNFNAIRRVLRVCNMAKTLYFTYCRYWQKSIKVWRLNVSISTRGIRIIEKSYFSSFTKIVLSILNFSSAHRSIHQLHIYLKIKLCILLIFQSICFPAILWWEISIQLDSRTSLHITNGCSFCYPDFHMQTICIALNSRICTKTVSISSSLLQCMVNYFIVQLQLQTQLVFRSCEQCI